MKCDGDVIQTSEPCPVCGAADDEECRRPIPELAGEREHYSILEDGPNRYVLVDDRTDDPAPVYSTAEAAADALDALVRERAAPGAGAQEPHAQAGQDVVEIISRAISIGHQQGDNSILLLFRASDDVDALFETLVRGYDNLRAPGAGAGERD